MTDPIKIFDRYVSWVSDAHNISRKKAKELKFTASNAGLCRRKSWYYANNALEIDKTNATGKRLLHHGTSIGKEFDKAMDWYQLQEDCDVKIYSEHPISLNRLELQGSFDLLIVDKDNKGHLYDYKSTNIWNWKQIFGLDESFRSPKDNNEYQLGTYAFMLDEASNLCDEVIEMNLLYYKKDDSVIKKLPVDNEYKSLAELYWTEVYEESKLSEPPVHSQDRYSPRYTWECKEIYCNYAHMCNSPYTITKKTKKQRTTKWQTLQ